MCLHLNLTVDGWKNRQNPLPLARTPKDPRKMNMIQTTRKPTSNFSKSWL